MYFHPKLAWPPATLDIISRNHSNWRKLSQNVCGGWTSSYWKRQVLMFYPLGKDSEKGYGSWHPPPSPPCTSEGQYLITLNSIQVKSPSSYHWGSRQFQYEGVFILSDILQIGVVICWLVCLLFFLCLREVVQIFLSSHNSWNLTPFCSATLPRLPQPPFLSLFLQLTSIVVISGKILQMWSTFLKK